MPAPPLPKKRGGPPPAVEPAQYDENDIRAIQALSSGNASEGQQKRALEWIVNNACQTYDLHYRPGAEGERDTAFALGRAFAGQQIVKMLRLRPKT